MFFILAILEAEAATAFKVSHDFFFFLVVILHEPADWETTTRPFMSVIVINTLFLVLRKKA
jgi:hypothetical protein